MRSGVSIAPLMGNPKAQDFYASIPSGVPPLELADEYRLACAKGEKDQAIALEIWIRQMTAMHCHRPEVHRALATVEHTAKRPLGQGGSQEFKRIARAIEVQYATGEYEVEAAADGNLAVFKIGSLTVRCRNNPHAVGVLVAKYNRGWRK